MRFRSDCAHAASEAKTIEQTARPRSHGPSNWISCRKKRKQQAHETVNAHLREHAGQNHRDADGRACVGIRQPGVKGKERHFHREPKKDSGKGEPSQLALQ